MPESTAGTLTGGRLLAKNTISSLAAQAVPVLVSLFAIPILIGQLGTDRFGVLTLAWVVIGYFSLFDFGLGRALTQLLAEQLGLGEQEKLSSLTWTSLLLMLGLGLTGAAILVAVTPWLVYSALKVPLPLQQETLASFYLLSASIPCVIVTAGLRGILEVLQRFDLINAIRIPAGIFNYLGPVLVLPFSRSLVPVVLVLAASRLITCLAHYLLCLRAFPYLKGRIEFSKEVLPRLLRFGGWMTVSNVISPLLAYVDRFLIGAVVSISAAAYYATPSEAVSRLSLVAGTIANVMFPAFATSYIQDRKYTELLFVRSLRYLSFVLLPVVLVGTTLSQEILSLWLGSEFASHSYRVAQWILIGIYVNSLAQIALCLVQAVGKPDLSARLHFVEAPLYLVGLYWLVSKAGIEGAALAWLARVTADMVLLFALIQKYLPGRWKRLRQLFLLLGVPMLSFIPAFVLIGPIAKLVYLFIVLPAWIVVTWSVLLAPEERQAMLRIVSERTLRFKMD